MGFKVKELMRRRCAWFTKQGNCFGARKFYAIVIQLLLEELLAAIMSIPSMCGLNSKIDTFSTIVIKTW
jgi:hypothetical protein